MRTIPPTISDIVNYNTMPQRKLFFGVFLLYPPRPLQHVSRSGAYIIHLWANKLPEERRGAAFMWTTQTVKTMEALLRYALLAGLAFYVLNQVGSF
jgi:hypothetical protein